MKSDQLLIENNHNSTTATRLDCSGKAEMEHCVSRLYITMWDNTVVLIVNNQKVLWSTKTDTNITHKSNIVLSDTNNKK